MTPEEFIISILDAGGYAGNVYTAKAPQSTTYPVSIINRVITNIEGSKSSGIEYQEHTYRINIYADTYKEVLDEQALLLPLLDNESAGSFRVTSPRSITSGYDDSGAVFYSIIEFIIYES